MFTFIEALKSFKDTSANQSTKLFELELKYKKADDQNDKLQTKIKGLEEKITKQDTVVCTPIWIPLK